MGIAMAVGIGSIVSNNALAKQIVDGSMQTFSASDFSGITKIEQYKFYSNTNLTSVEMPNSVTSVGAYAFYNCTNIQSIIFSTSLQSIGNYAFANCSGIFTNTAFILYDNLTTLGTAALRSCQKIKTITIGTGLTSIGDYAFYNCSGLTSITIKATNPPTLINSRAFTSTNNCPIYVPAGSVTSYQNNTQWASVAGRIQAIPT